MRYGVIADIHANLPALRAVLDTFATRGVERFIVAGDLVGYGPHPNECVEVVANLGAACVAGNHDLIVLGRLSDERCIGLARESLSWTASVLHPDTRAFLADLPLRANVGGRIEVAHGSLDDPQEYITPRQAVPQLARLEAARGESALLVLGHTHRAFACALRTGQLRIADGKVVTLPRQQPTLLQPGAVGQSRELRARARCMVLDEEARQVVFLAVPYDLEACRRSLRRAGLSPASCHLRPSPVRAATRVGRAVRRALFRGSQARSGDR